MKTKSNILPAILSGAFAVCLATSCIQSSGDSGTPGDPTNTERNGETTTSNGPRENLKVLEAMMKDSVTKANAQLDRADQLKPATYPTGEKISREDCQAVNNKVSNNYKLQVHQVITSTGDDDHAAGVDLCYTTGVHVGSYADLKTSELSLFNGAVKSLLGLPAAHVLSIGTPGSAPGQLPQAKSFEQILLDNNFKIIERVFTTDAYSEIATLNEAGDLLSRNVSTPKDPSAAYIWKNVSIFTSVDGTIMASLRVRRNDGKGVELIDSTYAAPYKLKWDAFEVTPLDYNGNYSIAGKTVASSYKSALYLQYYDKSGGHCGYGDISEQDKTIRNFGDITCDKEMDAQTIIR